MAFIADIVFDSGLDYITTNGESVYLCSQEPTTYTEATSTYALADENAMTMGSAAAGAIDGRRVIVPAITGGDVTGTGTVSHWAVVKTTATAALLATGALASSQAVTSGNTFDMAAFSITIRDAA